MHNMDTSDWKQKALLPKLLTEEDASYNAVLDLQQALANKDICNIALTGPFGSGKSSVLKTLMAIEKKNKNSKLNFLSISLATLDATKESENASGNDKNEANEILNRRIEYSILQQLIYRESRKTLPNSRLKRIPYISKKSICKISISILAFFACFCIAFEPRWLRVDILYRLFNWGYWVNGIFDILSLGAMCWLLYKACAFLIVKYGSSKLNQIKIAGGEIQIKDENSIFNQHLDEILYFFQCTKYNTVIIEDLDRFNTPDIFLKLRELNFLLNQSNIIEREIKFVYAIKDDMFNDASRTKFFDYITTVIPVISPYNSKDVLRKTLLELGHSDNEIDDTTIREVAFFIDDMRLLQNIVNEYHQYILRLRCNENHKINNNKLLAMIVYKNYYPHNFALLPQRAGEIYEALNFAKKKEYQDIAVDIVLQKRKASLQKQKEAFLRTQHLNQTELRKIYVLQYINHLKNLIGNGISLDGGGHFQPISIIWENEENFNLLKSTGKITYKPNNYSTSSIHIPFADIEREVDPNYTYQDRLNALSFGSKGIAKQELELTIEESNIRSYPIKDLLSQFKIYNESCYKELELSEMADRFIKIGLIAEDYYDYISIFYPGMISSNDHRLILDMKLYRTPDPLSHIDNIKSFLEELPNDVFLTNSVYNVELLDYLSLHSKEKIHYNQFQNLLYTQESFDFIIIYYKEGKNQERVLSTYIQSHPQEIWDRIVTTKNNQSTLFEIWIKYCTIDQIHTSQLDWINDHYVDISLLYNTLHHNKQEYLTTKAKYKTLAESSGDMLAKVVENSCYVVSEKTIPYVFKQKKAVDNISVLSTNEQKLAIKLNLPKPTWKNISIYFKSIDFIIDEALWSFIDDNVNIICQHKYDGISEIKKPLFHALMNSNHLNMQSYKKISLLFDDCNFALQDKATKLEEERIIWLIQKGFIEYSETNTVLTSNLSNKAFVEYLIHYKSHFMDDVNSYPYNEDTANMILTSQSFTIEEKAIVLPNLNISNVTMTKSLADSICTLLETKCVKWDFTLLKQAISMASNLDKAVNVAILTIKQNDNDYTIITELLQSLPAPYRKIAENGKRPIIDSTDINKLLLDTLLQCGYISSFTPEDKGYRVNTRQKIK